jgi:aspartate kinase
MKPIVAKFGGTSLATAECIRAVCKIVKTHPRRTMVVVSAPGKRSKKDAKVTDLLIALSKEREQESVDKIIKVLINRFKRIANELSVPFHRLKVERQIRAYVLLKDNDALVSYGERLCAQIVADALGFTYVDAGRLFAHNEDGEYDVEKSRALTQRTLAQISGGIVVPGFYYWLPDGTIKTLSRGGSDLTAARLAELVGADRYENWTDVSGVRKADPRIVADATHISEMTYAELRELTYMGASVMHDEVALPLSRAGIPTYIRNTFDDEADMTRIVVEGENTVRTGLITGISGKKNFTAVRVKKLLANNAAGFLAPIFTLCVQYSISVEHVVTGIDSVTLAFGESTAPNALSHLVDSLRHHSISDSVDVYTDLALIVVVGHGMRGRSGISADAYAALDTADVNVVLQSQEPGELSIIIGVSNADYETSIHSLYHGLK